MPDDKMPKFPTGLDLSNFPRTVPEEKPVEAPKDTYRSLMREVAEGDPRSRPAKRFYLAGISAGVILLIGLLIASSFVR